MEGCSFEQEDSMKALRDGINLVINSWSVIRRSVYWGYYGPQPELRLNRLCDTLFSCFIHSKDKHMPPSAAKIAVKAHLSSFFLDHEYDTPPDNSLEEVCDQLVAMYQECLQGDLSSIQIFKEANSLSLMWKQASIEKRRQDRLTAQDRLWADILHDQKIAYLKKIKKFKEARLLILRRKEKENKIQASNKFQMEKQAANSSSSSEMMDASNLPNWIKVFKEGVDSLIKSLWARHVIIHSKFGSKFNHSPMLQRLADYILFWFTQTIKPVSFDYVQWILRSEMYFLPPAVDAVTNSITKEVEETHGYV